MNGGGNIPSCNARAELEAARAAIEESDAKLRVAVAAAGVGIWSWDVERDAVTWDDELCAMFGCAPSNAAVDYQTYRKIIHPDDLARVEGAIARSVETGVYDDLEHRIFRLDDGALRWVLCRGAVLRKSDGRIAKLLGGVIDITERRALEERLRHAHKMDAVGQLTAGIAHNFNNLLTGILPSVELAMSDASPRALPLLENARQASVRAARMIKQLLLFAGGEVTLARRPERVTPIVKRTVDFFGSTLGSSIALAFEAPPELPLAHVDASQLEQAVLNLLINARDALEGLADRAPRIDVRLSFEPAEHAAGHVSDDGAGCIVVSVTDNGCGMSEQTQERMFEPFFTTKDIGRGTGLGLPSVYGIMREHQGRVRCDSKLRVGTTFRLELPALPAQG